MASVMNPSAGLRLERSGAPTAGDWMRIAPSCPGLERVEAFFAGHGFDPHRHDSYAIGFTIRGVQAFRYRGASVHSLPGQVFVLHPDEAHDGHAGTGAGFCYRILYLDPGAVQDALGGGRAPLPFVTEAVSHNAGLLAALRPALADLDHPLEELERDQIVLGLADALAAADPSAARRPRAAPPWSALHRARNLLDARAERGVGAAELEAVTGLTRYALARYFRACLGTSPYRYLIMRRLDRARALIRCGTPLAEAALASGFADQSHMTRHFRKAYGLPPGRWAVICRGRISNL
jgi:AraC-like DNA-binding protein